MRIPVDEWVASDCADRVERALYDWRLMEAFDLLSLYRTTVTHDTMGLITSALAPRYAHFLESLSAANGVEI
jgi:hypothetical protein